MESPLNEGKTSNQQEKETLDQRDIVDPESHDDQQIDQQIDIPTEPIHANIPVGPVQLVAPQCSSQIPQPSAGSLQSKEYQLLRK